MAKRRKKASEGLEGPAREQSTGDEVAEAERKGRPLDGPSEGFRGPGVPRRVARTVAPEAVRAAAFTGQQRLLLLDTWMRSQLPAMSRDANLHEVRGHELLRGGLPGLWLL